MITFFKVLILSSTKVGAQVAFVAASSFKTTTAFEVDDVANTFGYKNLDTKATSAAAENTGKIEVTLTPDEDDFASLKANATNAK